MINIPRMNYYPGQQVEITFPPVPEATGYICLVDDFRYESLTPKFSFPLPALTNWWAGITVWATVKKTYSATGGTSGQPSVTKVTDVFSPKMPRAHQMIIQRYINLGWVTHKVDFDNVGGGGGTVSGSVDSTVFVGHRMIRVMLSLPHPAHDLANAKVLTADQVGQWFAKVVPPNTQLKGWNGGDYYYCPSEKCMRDFVSTPRPLIEGFGAHTGWGPHPWSGTPTSCPVDCDDYAAIFWGEARKHFGGCTVAWVAGTAEWVSWQSHAFNLAILSLERDPTQFGLFVVDTTNYMQGMREIDLSVSGGSPQTNIWAAIW